MPGDRRGALPLFLVILLILGFGVTVWIVRAQEDDRIRADGEPTAPVTVEPTDGETIPPEDDGETIPPEPPEDDGETIPPEPPEETTPGDRTPAETTPATPAEPTTPPPGTQPPAETTPPVVSPGPGDLARTGDPALLWIVGGLALMLLSSAMLRALSRSARP